MADDTRKSKRCSICGLFMRREGAAWLCVRMIYIHYYGVWEHQVMSHDTLIRPHDAYCWKCDMAEFAGITYEAAHTEAVSPNRCRCR